MSKPNIIGNLNLQTINACKSLARYPMLSYLVIVGVGWSSGGAGGRGGGVGGRKGGDTVAGGVLHQLQPHVVLLLAAVARALGREEYIYIYVYINALYIYIYIYIYYICKKIKELNQETRKI